mgnify:CR=1 FL=1
MKAKEIIDYVSHSTQNGRPIIYPLYEALVYMLYRMGYNRRHIADALRVHPDTVSYALKIARDHMDIQDANVTNFVDEISMHAISLQPYFEADKDNGVQKVRTNLFIDGYMLNAN